MALAPNITTLGSLRQSGYKPRSIKDELRQNLISALKEKREIFKGVLGYDETVIPELQTAILSRHNILLLGLRGQAKTRIARLSTALLDEWTPIVAGSELNDDPLAPISRFSIDLINELGDATPVSWLHRDERYVEKLATPDVSVADLIGDLDPIKAANLKLSYADERVVHFGLIPRSHRSIFVINELPDLQARIQVALFNILQEKDVQIRGFKVRLPLDIQFIFTANPEDYTNRGSIVTPLKDRIESQILTHYPKTIEIAENITKQEARLSEEQKQNIRSNRIIDELVEQIAFEARSSEYIDKKSGVSARLTISAYENLFSAAERRLLISGEQRTNLRFSDLYSAIPAITGKVELVYEGEQEGPYKVALLLISRAIRSIFEKRFPNPEKLKRSKKPNPYKPILDWFSGGHLVQLNRSASDEEYRQTLRKINGLKEVVREFHPHLNAEDQLAHMELVLHGIAEFSLLSKKPLDNRLEFQDLLGSILSMPDDDDL